MSNDKETQYKVEKTPSMEDTLNETFGIIFNSNEQIGDKLVNIILSLLNRGVDFGVNMTLGSDITKKSTTDLKGELLKKLIIIKELAKDPIIQEKVGEATQQVVQLSLKTIEDVQQPLNDIVERLLEMIAETTNKTVRGSLETARGVATSAIAEVPVVGGLVDLALTAGIAFNRLGDFVSSTTSNALEITKQLSNIEKDVSVKTQQAYKTYKDTKEDIENRIGAVQRASEEIKNSVTQPLQKAQAESQLPPGLTQRGGRQKEISATLERITKRLASV